MLPTRALDIRRFLPLSVAASLLALTVGVALPPAHAQTGGRTAAAQTGGQTGVVTQPKADEKVPAKAIRQYLAIKKFLKNASPIERKLHGDLLPLSRKAQNKPVPAELPPPRTISVTPDTVGGTFRVARGAATTVRVDIRGTVTDGLLAAIEKAGGKVVYASRRDLGAAAFPVTAELPPSALETIAALPEVRKIRRTPPRMASRYGAGRVRALVPLAGTGSALLSASATASRAASALTTALAAVGRYNSEGDRAHAANQARATYGVSGAGVRIGVISDSNDFQENSQATGDLGEVTVLPGQSGRPASGEGTAMMEIVRDIAPGAQLYFATAGDSEAQFADNILALRDAGCNIIVDDILFLAEPAFQDGTIARAVNEVTGTSNVLYFAAAGNFGNILYGNSQAWEGDFKDSGQELIDPVELVNYGRIHEFPGGTFNSVGTPFGAYIGLQWSDPLGNSTNDYDIIVTDQNGELFDYAADFQSGEGDDPIEFPAVAVGGTRIYVVAYRPDETYPWPEPRQLRLYSFFDSLNQQTDSNTYHHAAGKGSIGVAATPASFFGSAFVPGPFPFPFNASNYTESFSSDGPRRHYFEEDGTPITEGNFLIGTEGGEIIPKPDLTAADGVGTTVPGFQYFPGFFGTSAAAPHAAAIAALVKSYRPSLTVEGMKVTLQSSCIDIMDPGFDYFSGAGILMANRAVAFTANFLDARTIRVTNVTSNSATVTWTTNLPADSRLDFSETITPKTETVENPATVTSHSLTMTGLRPRTRYFVDVRSANAALGVSEIRPITVTTLPAVNASVRISGVKLTRNSQGRIVAEVSLTNTTGVTATKVRLNTARLGTSSPVTTLPLRVGAIPNNGTVKVYLQFPSATAGATVSLSITGQSDENTIGYDASVRIP
ncbi:MAG: S8 family serine peptidase [Capsulimonadales bacterium]|nr:S8 family serine peptidase [Capsulimonadales bacterium]